MTAILFDLDGVLYEGDRPIPGAVEAIDYFQQNRIPHLFVTNTTSRPVQALVEKLAAMGIRTRTEEYLTPPLAAASWLTSQQRRTVSLFVPEATKSAFAGFSQTGEADRHTEAVIVGDLGEQWDFATLNRAFRLLIDNPDAPLLALGMTRYWHAEDGLRLDAGPFVAALRYATGREPVVMGKPDKAFFQAALDRLQVKPAEAIMIGDDIRGDIEGAQQAGLHTILVRTGKFRPTDLDTGIRPDTVIDSIADLAALWMQRSLRI